MCVSACPFSPLCLQMQGDIGTWGYSATSAVLPRKVSQIYFYFIYISAYIFVYISVCFCIHIFCICTLLTGDTSVAQLWGGHAAWGRWYSVLSLFALLVQGYKYWQSWGVSAYANCPMPTLPFRVWKINAAMSLTVTFGSRPGVVICYTHTHTHTHTFMFCVCVCARVCVCCV